MGCDIHWHSETRRNGVWACDQADSFTRGKSDWDPNREEVDMDDFHVKGRGRNYWLFGLLNAGVRSEWPWSFPYFDNLPDDASDEVKALHAQWDADAHSTSFKNRAELKAKLEELKLARAEVLINPSERANSTHVEELINRLEDIIKHLDSDVPDEDQRLIYWFDN